MNKITCTLPFLLLVNCLSMHSYAQTPSKTEKVQVVMQNEKQKLYEEGEKAIQKEKWDEALKKLEWLNIRYPNSDYVEQAKLSIIVCHIQQKEYEKALEAINSFMRHYPKSQWLGRALQLKSEVKAIKPKLDIAEPPKEHQEARELYKSAQTDIRYKMWDEALEKLKLITDVDEKAPYTEKAALWTIVCYKEKKAYPEAFFAAGFFMGRYPHSEWKDQILEIKHDIKIEKAEKDLRDFVIMICATTIIPVGWIYNRKLRNRKKPRLY